MKKIVVIGALISLICTSCVDEISAPLNTTIIPKPQVMSLSEGYFKLDGRVEIVVSDSEAMPSALFLEGLLEQSSKRRVSVSRGDAREGAINFKIDRDFYSKNPEAYSLSISSDGVYIKAGTNAGLFYGVQSLRQLMPETIESKEPQRVNNSFCLPLVEVHDEPRFGWRGYMKDVSRTFYSVDVIKKYLDVMALYKLNTFHLHLTDDQGWRVEIKRYPELTSEKATTFPEQYNQPAERSGYYTQDDIRDIVVYAAERNITVVPEIDVPGHSWPTLQAFPQLGVNDNLSPSHIFPFVEAWGHWGNQFTPNTLDPTSEAVYSFLDDVFSEIVDLFPSEYIHFGGDEVMHHFWLKEPHVVEFMARNSMKDDKELQSYFVKRVSEIIVSKGRKPIGWNDILADPSLTKESAIMCWLGMNAIDKAATNGYYSVASPTYPMYFDITQHDRNDGTMCDLNYKLFNTLRAVYEYNPTKGIAKDKQKYVLGVQANMWPAVPQEVKDINVQNFPRMLALSEVAWSSDENKDFDEFCSRVEVSKRRLDVLKIDYFREGGYIVDTWSPEDLAANYQVVEWDVTAKVYAAGRATAGFFTTKGESNLEIECVELLENGKVISEDRHHAVSPEIKKIFRPYNYYLEVKEYDAKAKYTIRASIKGESSSDSYGNVTFNLSPYVPFEVVER